uniref:Heat shock protein DnaJ domain protein n=1 Tax=Cyanothece sp. (strain PCC 7425 / ATCC 29141) TaxID=395961 RepID=B8HPM9_CYAP4
MNIADCYRLLELPTQADLTAVKASYRRLARRYHPDVNPGDRQAEEKFIQVTEAYKILVEIAPPGAPVADPVPTAAPAAAVDPVPSPSRTRVTVVSSNRSTVNANPRPKETPSSQSVRQPPVQPSSPPSSPFDQHLKQVSYQQLQELLKYQRFPRAIALVEGLAQRLPDDAEVRQWQAITYQCWARDLISKGQVDKARVYLKKALHTDPHNRSLWAAVNEDFRRLERIY